MKLNIDKKILYIIILLCLGCQSTSNKIDNKSRKSLLPINNSDSVVSEELKYDVHCLKYNLIYNLIKDLLFVVTMK